MSHSVSLPTFGDALNIELENGQSIFIVGANGAGKSKLAQFIENALGVSGHRISAQRAVSLPHAPAKATMDNALTQLRMGRANTSFSVSQRNSSRWNNLQPGHILNDVAQVASALFADQRDKAVRFYQADRAGNAIESERSLLEKLAASWGRIHPHILLEITDDHIKAVPASNPEGAYWASQMSDGERATFYLLGQVLCAAENSVLIFDEPEIHLHKAIMAKPVSYTHLTLPTTPYV